MTNNVVVYAIAFAAIAGFVVWYRRSRLNDRLGALMMTHSTAAICSRAQLVDGANHIDVALTLEPSQITYQNPDLNASIDIGQIDEVEYASDLMTGGIADGAVLRLRSHGRAIEFVLDVVIAEKWSKLLPPHRMGEAGQVHAT